MKNFYCLLLLVLLIACQKEEIKPITHPRFSIAFVQDIDETGVQFAANVYDLGSEEIIEHGFVYDKLPDPRFDFSEWVKQEGSPKEFFELKAEHSMAKGQKYFVAAFMRTPQSVIYSKAVEFESSGSVGFIFDGMDIPEEVYFEDEITIYGKNIGRNKNNYEFFVQGERGTVEELGEESIRVKLPFVFPFSADQQTFEFSIKNLDKTYTVIKNLKFRNPEFENVASFYDFRDTIRIKGQNLRTKDVSLFLYEGTSRISIPILSATDNEIAFLLKAKFHSYSPPLKLEIRRKEYDMSGKVNFTKTNVTGDRSYDVITSKPFDLEGENFNPFNPHIHQVIKVGGESLGEILGVLDNQRLSLRISDNGQLERQMTFRLKTFGSLSNNSFQVNIRDAYLRHTPGRANRAGLSGTLLSHGNKGYLFMGNRIIQIDPKMKSLQDLYQDRDVVDFVRIFATSAPTGEMILGALGQDGLQYLYSFDPVRNTVRKIAELPGNDFNFKAAFATENYLYFEGGAYVDGWGAGHEGYNLKVNLSSGEVIELDKKYIGYELGVALKSFYYRGELYGLSHDPWSKKSQLHKFDPLSERWQVLKSYPFFLHIRASELFTLRDFAYGLGDKDFRINMQSLEVEFVSNSEVPHHNNPLPPMVFTSNERFYQYFPYNDVFMEYDPQYFQY
jgi:hypothetical protein